MSTHFNGWQRKFGVLALVIACVATSFWMKSHRRGDGFSPNVEIALTDSGIELTVSYHDTDIGFFGTRGNVPAFLQHSVNVPYWSIIILMTLASAYLLFSKPRRTSAKLDLATA